MTTDNARRLMLGLGAGALAVGALSPRDTPAQTARPARREMLSAANFGAKGDDTSDDTAALQAANHDMELEPIWRELEADPAFFAWLDEYERESAKGRV